MKQRTQHYLILDRADRDNPRWVVAKACASHPAGVPGDLDRDGGLTHGTRWLGEFHADHFSWLEFLFGCVSALRMTYRGEECLATPISHHHSPWTEYSYHDCDETWGKDHRHD